MRSLRCLMVGTLAMVLLGCTSLPENLPRGAPGYAPAPLPDGPLAAVEVALIERVGPDKSGFALLQSNEDGLRWRLVLDANGKLRWTAGDDVRGVQPARNFWQRVEDVLFMASPRDLY